MSETVTLNTKGLDRLLKSLKSRPPQARVGVLGGKTVRQSAGDTRNRSLFKGYRGYRTPTNAEIGAAHEYGVPSKGIPQRSFLRIPISENLQKYAEESGAFDKEVFADVIQSGSMLPWMKKLAVMAESIVSDAFATGGFGKWPKWKDPNYTNNAGQLLVDTKQLRESITSEVRE